MNDSSIKLTRREFLITGATSAATVALPSAVAARHPLRRRLRASKVSFEVNGTHRELEVDTRTTLLDALREHLKLTGTKKGCDQGNAARAP